MGRAASVLAILSCLCVGSFLRAQPAPAPAADDKPPYGEVYALCIGINKYASEFDVGGNLNGAENDAQSVADIFSNRYGYRVETLLGPQATKAGIRTAIDRVKAKVGSDDVLIFYFAGHGVAVTLEKPRGIETADGYMLPQDIVLNKDNVNTERAYRDGAINMRELTEEFKKLNAKHVLLVLDCCASGMAARGGGSNIPGDFVKALASHPTRQVLSAGKTSEKVYETGDKPPHGVFTKRFITALRDDPVQPVSVFFPDLQRGVFQDIKGMGSGDSVMPQLKKLIDEGGDFVFIERNTRLNWKSAVASKKLPPGARARGQEEPVKEAEVQDVQKQAVAAETQKQDLSKDPKLRAQLEEYELRAAAGDTRAMEAASYCYSAGLGTEKDPEKAMYWAREASDAGNVRGAGISAAIYQSGYVGRGAKPDQAAGISSALNVALQGKLKPEEAQAISGLVTVFGNSGGRGTPGLPAGPGGAAPTGDQITGVANLIAAFKKNDKAGGGDEEDDRFSEYRDLLDEVSDQLNRGRRDWKGIQSKLRELQEKVRADGRDVHRDLRPRLDLLSQIVNELRKQSMRMDSTALKRDLAAARAALDEKASAK